MPSTLDHSRNADEFLKKHEFPLERSRIFVTYDDEREYIDIVRVDDENVGSDIKADALYTTDVGKVLTLPVADCVATVVYDPVTGMLALLHLGRQSSVAGLIEHFILEVADRLGSDPRDWHVWMSPSLRQINDRLDFLVLPIPTSGEILLGKSRMVFMSIQLAIIERALFALACQRKI